MPVPRCFQVHPADNVATLLDDAGPGAASVLGRSGLVVLTEPVQLGHKVALADIPEGGAVVKFGVPIGQATVPIQKGQWVHLHNLASNLDERSQTLDLHTGATTDTVYE